MRATTVIRSRDIRVANDDLSVSSQNSFEIHSHDIVFCRLETDNCVHFLLRRELILSCWSMMIVKRHLFVNELASSRAKTVSVTTATTWCGTLNESMFWSVLFCCYFYLFIYFSLKGQDKIYLNLPVTARALSFQLRVLIFTANTQQLVETKT